MVDRMHCTKCAGMGKIMALDEPPEDPDSGEGWEQCLRCKGTGVEMSTERFEVRGELEGGEARRSFADEVEAREYYDWLIEHGTGHVGIRRLAA